jgi:hypothetical protein
MQKSKIFIGFTKGLHLHPLSRISLWDSNLQQRARC